MKIQVKEFTSPQNEWVKWADKQFNEKTYLKEDTAKGEYDIKEDRYGTIQYYKPGTEELHRTDGPAVEYADGTKVWYVDGKRHRDGAPAIEYADGSEDWYQNGKLHRTDGPAIDRANGKHRWYINGVEMSEEQFIKKTALKEKTSQDKELTLAQLEEILGYRVKVIDC